jgi:hypothetical protein
MGGSVLGGFTSSSRGGKRGTSRLLERNELSEPPTKKAAKKKKKSLSEVIELLSSDDECEPVGKKPKPAARDDRRKSLDGVVDLCDSDDDDDDDDFKYEEVQIDDNDEHDEEVVAYSPSTNGDAAYARSLAAQMNGGGGGGMYGYDVASSRPTRASSRPGAAFGRIPGFNIPGFDNIGSFNQGSALARALAESARAFDPPPKPIDEVEKAIIASNREVVAEQNSAYEESLRIDKAKREKAKEEKEAEAEAKEMAEAIALSAEADKLAKEIELNRKATLLRSQLVPEEGDDGYDAVDDATVAKIKFKMPRKCSTPSLEKRFWITDTVSTVVAYLGTLDVLKEVEWSLETPRPVVAVDGEEWSEKNIKELGVVPRGMLIVRDKNA